jgi:hypothetical protein
MAMRPLILGVCAGLVLSGAALAQVPAPPPPASRADEAAIASRVREQLAACWSLPEGFAGQRFTVTLAFLGDGTLDGDPEIAASGPKTAAKLAPLVQSAVGAIRSCAPFRGLEALGAGARQRFSIAVDFAS